MAVSLAFVAAVLVAAMSAGVATASMATRSIARSVRLMAAPRSELSLLRAPPGLGAAVRRTLGARAAGDPWSQQTKLTAFDAAAGDEFGSVVAISGSTAVVGAPIKNSNTGAAYVFVRSDSDTRAWSEQAKLTASDAAVGDRFGWSVAISEGRAVVGALTKNSATGAAYVFVRSGATWSQQAKLTASDGTAGDVFGSSAAISGDHAVVGAPGNTLATGAAYVFVRSGTTWSQQAKLTASDGAARDQLGFSVTFSGSSAVVGAPAPNAGRTGAAYVFVRSGNGPRAWSQQAKLTAPDGAANDRFGFSVGIFADDHAVVGAPFNDSFKGAAYVFVRSGNAWSQQAKLTASDGAVGDQLGWSVAIFAVTTGPPATRISHVVVGAPGVDSHTGAAYVFTRSATAWSQQAKLTASDGAAHDAFGTSVAISAVTTGPPADRTSTGAVGSPGHNSATGAAYTFVE